MRYLVSLGVIEPLVEMLESEDARMLLVVMDAVSAILAVGKKLMANAPGSTECDFAMLFDEAGLPSRLEELQNHAQDDVYTRAMGIIEAYYNEEDVADDSVGAAQQAASQGAMFSFGAAGVAPHFGFGAAPSSGQVHTPSGGIVGHSHGVGGGVAPVQLFASPTTGSGFNASGGFFAAAPAPALPPSMFSFDSVSFV